MDQHPSPTGRLPTWATPRVIGAAGAALFFFIFAIQNARSVEVSFLFWNFDLRLIIVMLLSAAAGAGIWELIRYLRQRHPSG